MPLQASNNCVYQVQTSVHDAAGRLTKLHVCIAKQVVHNKVDLEVPSKPMMSTAA